MLAIALSFLAGAGFGTSAILARLGTQRLQPLPSVFISVIVSAVPTIILALVFAKGDIRALPPLAFLGFLGLGAVNFLGGRAQTFGAISRIGATQSSTILSTSAVFSAIFAISLAGERPHFLVALGTAAVVVGLVIGTGQSVRHGWVTDKRAILGYLMAVGAAASYGGTNVIAKELTQAYGSPLMISAFSLIFGVLLLAPMAGQGAVSAIRARTAGWGEFFFAGLSGLSSAVAVIALYYALQREDVVVVSPITSAYPLLTILMARIFISQLERITKRLVMGATLTLTGVIVVVIGSTY